MLVGAAGLALASLGVTACSSATGSGGSTTSGPATTSTASTTPTTSTTPAAAVNIPVTDQIRTQLVAAGAAVNGIPVSQYTGLAPGLTYYAFDRATATYWAGARLVPAPSGDPSSPTRAEVASQDEGSYYVFSQPQGGSWTAHAAGSVGPATPCPVSVPVPVLTLWGWPAGACRPPNA